jgi:hypothetical protein
MGRDSRTKCQCLAEGFSSDAHDNDKLADEFLPPLLVLTQHSGLAKGVEWFVFAWHLLLPLRKAQSL